MTIGLISNNELGSSVREKLNLSIDLLNKQSGWGAYADTVHVDLATAFSVPADTDTLVPNNAGSVIESQKPSDVSTFYDGTVITGRNGDNLDLMLYFTAVPSVVNQWLEVWLDITGGTGSPSNFANLYKQTFVFPRGAGEPRGVLFSLPSAYTLETWEANGAVVRCRSNATTSIYGINYNLDRSHKAR